MDRHTDPVDRNQYKRDVRKMSKVNRISHRKTGKEIGPGPRQEGGADLGPRTIPGVIVGSAQRAAGAGIVPAAFLGALGGRRTQRIAKAFDREKNRASLHHSAALSHGPLSIIHSLFLVRSRTARRRSD